MTSLEQVPIAPLPPERFETVLEAEQYELFHQAIERGKELFAGRTIWNLNSTAKGGGVVELLRSLVAYARGAEVDVRWAVIQGDDDFFRVTKRIHNNLHGSPGDGGGLGNAERHAYESTLERNAEGLLELLGPDDVVILHDPQTAGLIQAAKGAGVPVIWRCHVGLDLPNDISRRAWRFLIPYACEADSYIFSREAFEWEGLDKEKMTVIPPSIDAFSPKNQDISEASARAILAATGLTTDGLPADTTFMRVDGSQGEVHRRSEVFQEAALDPGDRFVLQVSRWDRLKDPLGVIRGFADEVAPHTDAHLIYAGPAVEAVADDPEGAEVLKESQDLWQSLPAESRKRVHLACLPMEDGEENAVIVNALQREADVVVQKSLAEGFGLTVAEAMWKARPMVASEIGGIQDQIVHEESGLLLKDPTDAAAYGTAVRGLLEDPGQAGRMGVEAQRRVRDEFLGVRSLLQYMALIQGLIQK